MPEGSDAVERAEAVEGETVSDIEKQKAWRVQRNLEIDRSAEEYVKAAAQQAVLAIYSVAGDLCNHGLQEISEMCVSHYSAGVWRLAAVVRNAFSGWLPAVWLYTCRYRCVVWSWPAAYSAAISWLLWESWLCLWKLGQIWLGCVAEKCDYYSLSVELSWLSCVWPARKYLREVWLIAL